MPNLNLDAESDSSSEVSSAGGLLDSRHDDFEGIFTVGIGHWEAARMAEEGYAHIGGESPCTFGTCICSIVSTIVRVGYGLVTLAKETFGC